MNESRSQPRKDAATLVETTLEPHASPRAAGVAEPSLAHDALNGRPTWVRYKVLAWLCLSATIAYIQRNSIGVAESTIRADLKLSEFESGLMLSAFFITYAVFQLPTGWLSGVWGSRLALTIFTSIWSAFTAAMAVATGPVSIITARFGMGALQAGVFPCATQSIAQWFPRTRRGLASGALSGFMSVGGFVGALLTGYLVVHLGWRLLFALYALPGFLWAAGFWFWFRDQPSQHRSVNHAELALIRAGQTDAVSKPSRGIRTPWRVILSSPAMWFIGGQQFFRAAGYIFFATWFATYLQESRGISIASSGLLTAMPVIAVSLGSMLGGGFIDWVYERTGSVRIARQGVGAISVLLCGLLIIPSYFVESPALAVALISAGSFCAAFAGPCAYAISIDVGGRHVTTVFSFMNMCGNVGAALFPLVVPLVKAAGGWGTVLFMFAGIYVASSLCWLMFDGRKPIVPEDKDPAASAA